MKFGNLIHLHPCLHFGQIRNQYIAAYGNSRSDGWNLAVFLKRTANLLYSGWVRYASYETVEELLGQPRETCMVRNVFKEKYNNRKGNQLNYIFFCYVLLPEIICAILKLVIYETSLFSYSLL